MYNTERYYKQRGDISRIIMWVGFFLLLGAIDSARWADSTMGWIYRVVLFVVVIYTDRQIGELQRERDGLLRELRQERERRVRAEAERE
jgi:hypothetical protein